MEVFSYFGGILFYVPFYLLFMFHVFIRPKLSLVWALSHIIGFVLLVPVISVAIFSIYKYQVVFPRLFLLPCIIIFSVAILLYSVHIDLGGYHWHLGGYQRHGICLILVVAFCVFQYIINPYMISKLRWIRRECRLLDAACIDVSKACGVTRLQHLEEWMKQTKVVIDDAKRLIEDVQPHVQQFLSRQRLFLHLNKVISISNDISGQRKNARAKGIYSTLENYCNMIQSLKDMVIEDESGSASRRQLKNHVTTIRGKVTKNLSQDGKEKIGLKLELLEAFLNDLQQVKLKWTIEGAWLEEMKSFMDDILIAFETFRERNKRLGLNRLLRKKTLDGEVGWMADGLTELLKAKEEFGFKFTIVQPQTHPDQNKDVNNEDLILCVIKKIRTRRFNRRTNSYTPARADKRAEIQVMALAQEVAEAGTLEWEQAQTEALTPEQAQAVAKARELAQAEAEACVQAKADAEAEADLGPGIISLCERLEGMHGHLKAIDRASNFRSVSLKQLNEIGSELKGAFENYIEQAHPVKLETSRIESPIKLAISRSESTIEDLEIFMKAYDYKVRRKYSSIIGLEKDTHDLSSKLMDRADSEFRIFTIVGMQGIGKSTLAREVYHHISQHFQFHKLVDVPNNSNDEQALLSNVGDQITTIASQKQEEGEIEVHYSQRIRNFLQQQRKYLLVLDNVPKTAVWRVLKQLFPEERNGSRILLTTRDRTLASDLDHANKPHHLRLRTKEESWDLFLEMAQIQAELLSKIETKKAKQDVDRCSGLPSSISLLGTECCKVVHASAEDSAATASATPASSGANTVDSLLPSWVFKEVNERQQHFWSEASQINDLCDDLKSLISYFALFPRNYEIPARRLFALWEADGLVQQNDEETNNPKNIAKECLSKLIDLNIIQPLENSVHGKVKTCRLPQPLQNAVLPLSRRKFSPQLWLAYHCNRDDCSFSLIHVAEDPAQKWAIYEDLISLISFDMRKGDNPGRDIGNFLRKGIANGCFQKLKVLDLERVFRPQLPKTIDKLTELVYLGLRWTYLENIPSTIGNLSNLQTLDLKHTYIRTLPHTIWKLQELRHLYLNQTYRSKFVHQSKTKSLGKLQTLWGVFLDKNSPLKDRIDGLTSLRKLGLAFQLNIEQQIRLAERIVNLKHLQTLRLKSVGVMSEPQELYLGKFSKLDCLSNMYLFGKLHALSSLGFPRALSNLTLSSSELESDPMQILGKLDHLKSLCLFSNSFKGNRMASYRGGFSELVVLKMWNLDHLTDWIIEEGTMLNLEELEIRCCSNLNVPDGLRHLKTLRQLKLRNMSGEFSKTCSSFVSLSIIDSKTLSNQY